MKKIIREERLGEKPSEKRQLFSSAPRSSDFPLLVPDLTDFKTN